MKNTPAETLGFKVGDKFQLKSEYRVNYSWHLDNADLPSLDSVFFLDTDDGTGCPWFKFENCPKFPADLNHVVRIEDAVISTQEGDKEMNTKTKNIKFPCAVSTAGLSQEQLNNLHTFFLENGAEDFYPFCDLSSSVYVGVDWSNRTNHFIGVSSFSSSFDESEVTIYTYQELLGNQEESTVEYNPWIEWNGGEIPVPKGTMVEVKFRDGGKSIVTAGMHSHEVGFNLVKGKLCAIQWTHSEPGHDWDIVAYRLHEDAPTSPSEAITEDLTEGNTKGVDKGENPSENVVEPSETIGEVKLKIVGHSVIQRLGDIWSIEVKDGEVYFYD